MCSDYVDMLLMMRVNQEPAICRLAVEAGDDLGPISSEQSAALSQQQMLESLQQAYQADSHGMQFWETARSHRCRSGPLCAYPSRYLRCDGQQE